MSLDFSLVNELVCPHCNGILDDKNYVFEANITHNLTEMASEADIYKVLWRPDENGFMYAKDCIATIEKGLSLLKEKPSFYKTFDATNGWGVYEHFVPFVEKILKACKEYPDAKVEVCR